MGRKKVCDFKAFIISHPLILPICQWHNIFNLFFLPLSILCVNPNFSIWWLSFRHPFWCCQITPPPNPSQSCFVWWQYTIVFIFSLPSLSLLCTGQNVLVIGAGPSGMDLANEISKVAKRVTLSHHQDPEPKTVFNSNVDMRPDVGELTENGVVFVDGTVQDYSVIVYCTGYKYTFPFLSIDCGIHVEDNYVQPLYKHCININHPTMALIGVPFYVCASQMFDLQVCWYQQQQKYFSFPFTCHRYLFEWFFLSYWKKGNYPNVELIRKKPIHSSEIYELWLSTHAIYWFVCSCFIPISAPCDRFDLWWNFSQSKKSYHRKRKCLKRPIKKWNNAGRRDIKSVKLTWWDRFRFVFVVFNFKIYFVNSF